MNMTEQNLPRIDLQTRDIEKTPRTQVSLEELEIATNFYVIKNPEEGKALFGELEHLKTNGLNLTTNSNVINAYTNSELDTEIKLHEMGLTLPEYLQAYKALQNKALETLRNLIKISEIRLGQLTQSDEYTTLVQQVRDRLAHSDFQDIKAQIVHEILDGKEATDPKMIVILAGPMGAGKSLAREGVLVQNSHIVSADPDALREHAIPGYDHKNRAHIEASSEIAHHLSDEIFDEALRRNLNVFYEGSFRKLDKNLEQILDCVAKGYKVVLTYVYTPLEECLRRAVIYRDRTVPLKAIIESGMGLINFLTLINGLPANSILQTGIIDNSNHISNGSKSLNILDVSDPKVLEWAAQFSEIAKLTLED